MLYKRNGLFLTSLLVLAVLSLLAYAVDRGRTRGIAIRLPGTQPGQADSSVSLELCRACHEQQYQEWSGTMKAHAPRDPVVNALLSITTKYTEPLGLDVGEYCLRCHTASGWLAGRSHPGSTEGLRGSDLEGVNCDFCHRMVDPLNSDSSVIDGGIVPGYGNAMYVIQHSQFPVRGARGTEHPVMTTRIDRFYRTSEYCGVCHDVSNPYLSADPQQSPPHLQFPWERTYSEWKLSWYASQQEAGTCQSCHMKRAPGFSTSWPPFRYRLDISSHELVGGNTFGPFAVLDTWKGVNRNALITGVERSVALLATAATIEVSAGRMGDSVMAIVRVMNVTGHKLPTGFTEGRQMWISVVGRDAIGNVVFSSGRYNWETMRLERDDQVKVYEAINGMTAQRANIYGLTEGPSFHIALNDTVLFDNRIPPRGYSYAEFRERRCEAVGYHYSDGQYWDLATYSMTGVVETIEVALWYQVVSKEFAEFLRDENMGNPYDWSNWGAKVFESWQKHGSPVRMAYQSVMVQTGPPELPPVSDFELPVEVQLAQNYPNPFNGETTIEFWISAPSRTSLILYDLQGKEVSRVIDADLPAGLHGAKIDGSSLASGVYFYRLSTGRNYETRKLLVVR